MPRGFTTNERIETTDVATGVRVVQLTSYPVPSTCFFYCNQNFTPDGRTLILLSQREARRNAPWDLWRVDADGANLTQMTELDDAGGYVLSRDGRHVYYQRGGSLWRVGMDDLREEEMLHHGSAATGGHGFLSADGAYYYTAAQTPGNSGRLDPARPAGILRVRTDGSESVLIEPPDGLALTLHSSSPGGPWLLGISVADGAKTYHLLDLDANPLGVFTRSHDFAHCTFLGREPVLQGCALPPGRQVERLGVGDETPGVIARGPYFWHSGASLDGQWIVADTNWPDEGLQLIHVPTGRFRRLCLPRSSEGHAQMTHPHPQLSPDGRAVLFNSDRTGVPQVYLARVPDDLRDLTIRGDLTVADRIR